VKASRRLKSPGTGTETLYNDEDTHEHTGSATFEFATRGPTYERGLHTSSLGYSRDIAIAPYTTIPKMPQQVRGTGRMAYLELSSESPPTCRSLRSTQHNKLSSSSAHCQWLSCVSCNRDSSTPTTPEVLTWHQSWLPQCETALR